MASSTYWTEQRTIRQFTFLRTSAAYSSLSSWDPLIRKTSVERPSPSDSVRAHLPVFTVPPNRVFQVVDLPEFLLPITATNRRSAIALPARTDALCPDRRVYDLSPSAVLFDAGEEGEFGGRGEEAGFDGVRGEGAELVGAEAGGRGQISVILGFAGVGWRGYTTQLSENFRGTKPCAD